MRFFKRYPAIEFACSLDPQQPIPCRLPRILARWPTDRIAVSIAYAHGEGVIRRLPNIATTLVAIWCADIVVCSHSCNMPSATVFCSAFSISSFECDARWVMCNVPHQFRIHDYFHSSQATCFTT